MTGGRWLGLSALANCPATRIKPNDGDRGLTSGSATRPRPPRFQQNALLLRAVVAVPQSLLTSRPSGIPWTHIQQFRNPPDASYTFKMNHELHARGDLMANGPVGDVHAALDGTRRETAQRLAR